jgi:hypothetical protein
VGGLGLGLNVALRAPCTACRHRGTVRRSKHQVRTFSGNMKCRAGVLHLASASHKSERGVSVGKWVVPDRRYKRGYRWTPEFHRARWKWTLLIITWLVIVVAASSAHNSLLPLAATIGFIWYAIHRFRVNHRQSLTASAARAVPPQSGRSRFNPSPDGPLPPLEWMPPASGKSAPSWPYQPSDWQPGVPDQVTPLGERNSRAIPQDVKIKVAARDKGRCRQCGSTTDLHFDHIIPWSKAGANTVANIQLLCGPCNRRKGADDISAEF